MPRQYRVFLILTLGSLIAACATVPAKPESELSEEKLVAKQLLTDLQAPSFRENSEFCGMLLRDENGTIVRTEHFKGTKDRCRVAHIPDVGRVVASYHTHGSFLQGYDNEVPSVQDLEEEMEWRIDGFVATPGGRLWHVDGRAGTVNLLCGQGCLPVDPLYQDQTAAIGPIRAKYDFKALLRRSQLEDRVE